MNTLKNLPWKRILAVLLGAGGVVESLGTTIPSQWQAPLAAIGGLVGGAALNAERIMAKRNTPAKMFDTDAARAKVDGK